MNWKLEKWLQKGEEMFGREKILKHCNHDIYKSFQNIAIALPWQWLKMNPWPLRGYDLLYLKSKNKQKFLAI